MTKSNPYLTLLLQLPALHCLPPVLPRGQRRCNRQIEHLHHVPRLDRLLYRGDFWSAAQHVHGLDPLAAFSDLHGHYRCSLRGILGCFHNRQDHGPEPRFLVHD